jgi:hypothetical protein
VRVIRGAYAKNAATTERLLEHLAGCNECAGQVRAIRENRTRKRITLVFALAAASILIAIGLRSWFTGTQHSNIVVLDLRDTAPTRGAEAKTVPAVAAIHRGTGSIHVVLPVGSGRGVYQVGLFDVGEPPRQMQFTTENAIGPDSRLEIPLHFDFKQLAPGRYLVGLRRDGFPGDFYPVNVQ